MPLFNALKITKISIASFLENVSIGPIFRKDPFIGPFLRTRHGNGSLWIRPVELRPEEFGKKRDGIGFEFDEAPRRVAPFKDRGCTKREIRLPLTKGAKPLMLCKAMRASLFRIRGLTLFPA